MAINLFFLLLVFGFSYTNKQIVIFSFQGRNYRKCNTSVSYEETYDTKRISSKIQVEETEYIKRTNDIYYSSVVKENQSRQKDYKQSYVSVIKIFMNTQDV